jgi:hypothetical protein
MYCLQMELAISELDMPPAVAPTPAMAAMRRASRSRRPSAFLSTSGGQGQNGQGGRLGPRMRFSDLAVMLVNANRMERQRHARLPALKPLVKKLRALLRVEADRRASAGHLLGGGMGGAGAGAGGAVGGMGAVLRRMVEAGERQSERMAALEQRMDRATQMLETLVEQATIAQRVRLGL